MIPAVTAADRNMPQLKRKLKGGVSVPTQIKRHIRKVETNWAQKDSNLRPRDYESPALPLSYGPQLFTVYGGRQIEYHPNWQL
jgi:hypothetical protein